MIFFRETNRILGSLRWIDKGAIWILDLENHIERRCEVPGAQFVSLKAGKAGHFLVVHHMSESTAASVRHVGSPDQELASLQFRDGAAQFHGRSELWWQVETAILQVFRRGYRLFVVDPIGPKATHLDLSWYTAESYDLSYQGLVDCMTLPDDRRVVVSVQRSSDLVILDKESNRFVETARLPGSSGNPELAVRSRADFLASDYDTLARVDAKTFRILSSARLQDAGSFIGHYHLWSECLCAVARPFGSDVILVDPMDFRIVGRTMLGGQPLSVCMISETQVIARDWKSGAVSAGTFQPSD